MFSFTVSLLIRFPVDRLVDVFGLSMYVLYLLMCVLL